MMPLEVAEKLTSE
jgi:hypothetical protein